MLRWNVLSIGLGLVCVFGCSSSATNDQSSGGGGSATTGGNGGSAGSSGSAGASSGGAAGARRMFVTSAPLYLDAFGPGVAGADQECTTIAKSATLPGIWLAVLSDGNQSAAEHLNVDGPITNMNGETLASNEAALWDGNLDAGVAYDEFGDFAGGVAVWTGTSPGGESGGGDCESWSSQANTQVLIGSASATSADWVASGQGLCSDPHALYCLEQ